MAGRILAEPGAAIETLGTPGDDGSASGIDAAISRAIRFIELTLAWLLLAIIVLNVINVVGRYVFSRTILGADETQTYGMIWIAFVGAAVVTWHGEHLRMDALLKYFPARFSRSLRIVELAIVIVLAVFVVVHSSLYTARMVGVNSAVGGIPMWIPHSAVAAGYALITLLCIRLLINGRRP